ncbi:MAG: superoxide dismutase family protein [Dehalococcoidia bacterium]
MSVLRFGGAAIAAAAALSSAVALADDGGIPTHDYKPPAVVSLATTLVGTDGKFLANVQFHEDASGTVLVILDATKLPAGPHGIHIHAVGECGAPAFTTAGGHFNPDGKKHGLDSAEGPHGGDLPQIDAKTVSQGYYTATTKRVSLTAGAKSLNDADGSALVVHASADDQVTDPTGNSGGRIACAVIAAPKAAPASAPASAPAAPAATPKPPATGSGLAGDDRDPALLVSAVLAGLALAASGLALARRRG